MLHRILSKFPIYRNRQAAKLQLQSKFYEQNRINVLTTYRHFLKMIPKIYPRTLQQAQKINEIRWIYKSSKQLPNMYQTEGRTNLALKILTQIKKGDYSNLGDFVPHRYPNIFTTTEQFMKEQLPRKKWWWWGHIY